MAAASNVKPQGWRDRARHVIRRLASVIWGVWMFSLVFGIVNMPEIDRWFFPAVYWQERIVNLESELRENQAQLAAAILELMKWRRSSDLNFSTNLFLALQDEPDAQKAIERAAQSTVAEAQDRLKLVSYLAERGGQLSSELDRARSELLKLAPSPEDAFAYAERQRSSPLRLLLFLILTGPLLLGTIWFILFTLWALVRGLIGDHYLPLWFTNWSYYWQERRYQKYLQRRSADAR